MRQKYRCQATHIAALSSESKVAPENIFLASYFLPHLRLADRVKIASHSSKPTQSSLQQGKRRTIGKVHER